MELATQTPAEGMHHGRSPLGSNSGALPICLGMSSCSRSAPSARMPDDFEVCTYALRALHYLLQKCNALPHLRGWVALRFRCVTVLQLAALPALGASASASFCLHT